jgi:hypothetical protein
MWEKYIKDLQEKYPNSKIVLVHDKSNIKIPQFGTILAEKINKSNSHVISNQRRFFMRLRFYLNELCHYFDRENGEESDYMDYIKYILKHKKYKFDVINLNSTEYQGNHDKNKLLTKVNLFIQISQMRFNDEIYGLLIEQITSHFNNVNTTMNNAISQIEKPTLVITKSKKSEPIHEVYYLYEGLIYYPAKFKRNYTNLSESNEMKPIEKITDADKLYDYIASYCIGNKIVEISPSTVFDIFNYNLPYQKHWIVDDKIDVSSELNYFDKSVLVGYIKSCNVTI